MNIVFFSGSDISIPFAKALIPDIKLIVTLPPKIRGRGSKVTPNPLKIFADENSIDVLEIEDFNEETVTNIKLHNPEVYVVFSFGKIIPKEVLELVKCPLNVHPSDLPYYRGASPIERQLMDGVSQSAVTIMKMNEKLDQGEIILKKHFEVSLYDDYYSFLEKVYEVGIPLVKEALQCCLSDTCLPIPQESKGTYAKKITSEEEKIDWSKDAISIHNKVRALTRIGAYTTFRGKKLKIFKTVPIIDLQIEHKPGTIVEVRKDFFIVATGNGCIKVIEVQLEGKRVMNASDFINGYKPQVLEVLI
jgi:methionyl-tRNA formyltransferase